MITYMLLNNLDGPTRKKLCWDFYVGPYTECFLNTEHNEDPHRWLPLLTEAVGLKPKTYIIVALDDQLVIGGIITEYYSTSHCYFTTHAAVKKNYRKYGVFQELSRQIDMIVGECPHFAECEYPTETSWQETRLSILKKIGWKRVEILYTKPFGDVISLPIKEQALLLKSTASTTSIVVVAMFLFEFYTSKEASHDEIAIMLNQFDYVTPLLLVDLTRLPDLSE